MKITNLNNVSFGLKIVKNKDYDAIVNYRKRQGDSQKEIDNSFERISKLHDDHITLEFCNAKEEYFDILGLYAMMSNIKLSGFMRASDSNNLYVVDRYETKKCSVGCETALRININDLLRLERKRIDVQDWEQ